MIFVTGGAGFIGSNFISQWLYSKGKPLLNIDCLTYAGNLENNATDSKNPNYAFSKTNIGDFNEIFQLLVKYKPQAILNFAAESHVDRSILGPSQFVQTNVVGTFQLLEACKQYWNNLSGLEKKSFRFLHISTDEVYGSLGANDPASTEQSRFQPNSPYAASKAASDHLVRSFYQTYALPVLTINCSNNYGPRQNPEKFVPLVIQNALRRKNIPIYGDGLNIRDWLFVEDHCSAIIRVLEDGEVGETYNVGGANEKKNIEVVDSICEILDVMRPLSTSYKNLKSFVADRPGHDRRYAVDASKIKTKLGWRPRETFESGLKKTISWYLENESWVNSVVTRVQKGNL